jgi:hypothetical protein
MYVARVTRGYDATHDNVATKADVDNIRNELAIAVRDLKIWAGSIAVIIAGLLFGALHQWPPQSTSPQVAGSPALPGR